MQWRNTPNQYGWVAISLHWLIAIIVIGLIIVGLYMVELTIGLRKLQLYGWHKEYGILVLFLVILRLAWRLSNLTPELPAHMPTYEKIGARSAHYLFYILLFTLPLTGWMMSSAAGLPVSFFHLFILPDLVSPDPTLMQTLISIHKWLAYTLIAILTLHILAALQHHFYYKDEILKRILHP